MWLSMLVSGPLAVFKLWKHDKHALRCLTTRSLMWTASNASRLLLMTPNISAWQDGLFMACSVTWAVAASHKQKILLRSDVSHHVKGLSSINCSYSHEEAVLTKCATSLRFRLHAAQLCTKADPVHLSPRRLHWCGAKSMQQCLTHIVMSGDTCKVQSLSDAKSLQCINACTFRCNIYSLIKCGFASSGASVDQVQQLCTRAPWTDW